MVVGREAVLLAATLRVELELSVLAAAREGSVLEVNNLCTVRLR